MKNRKWIMTAMVMVLFGIIGCEEHRTASEAGGDKKAFRHLKASPVASVDGSNELKDLFGASEDKDEGESLPVVEPFANLNSALDHLYRLQQQGGWPIIKADAKAYKAGDSSAVIQLIKRRLAISGDYKSQENSAIFTYELKQAVQKAQQRLGLEPDGVIGSQTLQQLNIPVEARIKQVLINIERMRSMPPVTAGKRVVANIPEYKLHVYEGTNKVFDMRIVVGTAANKTVVFNDEMKYIVFSPYWNVPQSIVRNEILPAIQRDPSYLIRNNMEETGTRNGLPVIRQKPGPGNALGRVKFLFPNNHSIYFHDTPAKSLFDRAKRAFSHGCIRLEEPQKLAAYLLKDEQGWNESRIDQAMYADREKWVTLSQPVPVMITYITAWIDDMGVLNFRPDIYGHDKRSS